MKDINKLNSNLINVGQKLKIINDDLYTVKKGDTLYSIARNNNTTVNELKRNNNLSTDNLYVGQELLLKKDMLPDEDYITYTVVAGDNLYQIAQKYNTTVSDIVSLNNLSTSVLQVGQSLLIPKV